jgi:hypothetical protein
MYSNYTYYRQYSGKWEYKQAIKKLRLEEDIDKVQIYRVLSFLNITPLIKRKNDFPYFPASDLTVSAAF